MSQMNDNPRFQVAINGQQATIAGLQSLGVMDLRVAWIRRTLDKPNNTDAAEPATKYTLKEEGIISCRMGAMDVTNQLHVQWLKEELKIGDVVTLTILPAGQIEKPIDERATGPIPLPFSQRKKLQQQDCKKEAEVTNSSDSATKARTPSWIQGPVVPVCCGHAMRFVGQLNDDKLCSERPEGAKLWWHDAASFYVFTCSQCLECKAVGQQY